MGLFDKVKDSLSNDNNNSDGNNDFLSQAENAIGQDNINNLKNKVGEDNFNKAEEAVRNQFSKTSLDSDDNNSSSYGSSNNNNDNSYGSSNKKDNDNSYGSSNNDNDNSYGFSNNDNKKSSYGSNDDDNSYGSSNRDNSDSYGSSRNDNNDSYGSSRNDNNDSYGSSKSNDSYGSSNDDSYGSSKKNNDSYGSSNDDSYGSSKKNNDSYGSSNDDSYGSSKSDSYGSSKSDSYGSSKSDSYGSSKSDSYGSSNNDNSDSYGSSRNDNSDSYGSSRNNNSDSYGSSRNDNSDSYGSSNNDSYGSSRNDNSDSYGSSRNNNSDSYGSSRNDNSDSYGSSNSRNDDSYGSSRNNDSYGSNDNSYVSKLSTPYRSRIFEAGASTALVPTTSSVNTIPSNNNDYFEVSNVDINEPLQLASKYVDVSLLRDKTTPILEDISFHGKAVDYNYATTNDGLGAFQPFERTEIISIPDEILKQYNSVETNSKMGIFPEISRAWVIVDNRLIFWNLSKTSEFQTFEEIKHTILNVKLIKPKPNVFAETINYLLLVATPFDIHILAASYKDNSLDLYETGMVVPTHGLGVDQFITNDKTNDVYFTGIGDGLNIWQLQYSNTEDWFNKKCNKRCLTRSSVSSLIPGSTLINSITNYFSEDNGSETVVQLSIDSTRGVLYTLSNHSIIRAYKIKDSGAIEDPLIVKPSDISTYARTSSAKASPLLSNKYLKIVSINPVTRFENDDLFLVAVTLGGCRLYLNGSISTFSVSALRLESVKFPPTKITEEEIAQEQNKYKEQEALKTSVSVFSTKVRRDELPTILTYQKKSSVLLESKKTSKIISPGIFFDVVSKENSKEQKLFVSVPDYGVLKYHNKYIENATFLESFGEIQEIVPLSPTFNATDRPQGYANEFATQYSKNVFEIAVLTNTSLQIYRYRTPDSVFESLVDDYSSFISKYGYLESASTALYVTCKYNIPKVIRTNAFSFFTLGIPNLVEFKPTYKKTKSMVSLGFKPSDVLSFQNVILSPRFFAIVTLVGRLFREVWNEKVFKISGDIKYNKTGAILKESIFENEFLESINVNQNDIEFYLSSISVLNEFFQTYGNTIACFVPSSFQHNSDKFEEFANQAENIAINSIIRLIISIKEALSFFAILIKESDSETHLKDIFKNLSFEIQQSLSKLTFKEVFAPTEESKNLIKEILSSIINKNMSRGESIEFIAKGLQERCGTFCSTNDVIGFRAMEHLRKAKEMGSGDFEGISYHLNRAIELFQVINNDISLEKLKECIDIMISLNEYPKAIKFALKISSSIDPGNLASQYISDGKLANDDREKSYIKRHEIFDIVFQLLVNIDKLAIENSIKHDQSTDFNKIRDDSYDIAFKFEDKLFQFELYDWFITQDASERLLEIDTPYVLSYLESKSQESLIISDLLWIYQSKKGNYYEAALTSYSLALSEFEISLTQRNEYLSRAIGFCNCITLPSQRQQVIQLSCLIEEVFEASNVQYDLLIEISNDRNLEESQKEELIGQLNGVILTVNELFNDFANVLRYDEICLEIFKISDFRNSEEILSRYIELFDGLKHEKELLKQRLIKIGKRLQSSEIVFPINELIPLLLNVYQQEEYEIVPGEIIRVFIESGVSYDKLYYILRDLVDVKDLNSDFYSRELLELVKIWYTDDLKLREILKIENLNSIDLNKVHEQIEQIVKSSVL